MTLRPVSVTESRAAPPTTEVVPEGETSMQQSQEAVSSEVGDQQPVAQPSQGQSLLQEPVLVTVKLTEDDSVEMSNIIPLTGVYRRRGWTRANRRMSRGECCIGSAEPDKRKNPRGLLGIAFCY